MNTPIKHEKDGYIKWRLPNGELHREDGPAVIDPDGTQYWYQDHLLHREDGPAIVYYTGEMRWYQYGILYREDGPSAVYPDGETFWMRDDKFHRTDGPAVRYADGCIEYWIEGNEYDPVTFLVKSYEYTNKTA